MPDGVRMCAAAGKGDMLPHGMPRSREASRLRSALPGALPGPLPTVLPVVLREQLLRAQPSRLPPAAPRQLRLRLQLSDPQAFHENASPRRKGKEPKLLSLSRLMGWLRLIL